jgi:diacylglycerol kinase family enzyme
MAGGDGSLAPVAGVVAEEDRAFVCIPFGTRNHFARDLGLDVEDPIAVLAAFDGEERRVDIGRAGEHWFVNNVSLGLYASFVHDPAKKTRNRLVALARMLPAALGRSRTPLDLSLEAEGRREHRSALVVLVANNGYAMQSMAADASIWTRAAFTLTSSRRSAGARCSGSSVAWSPAASSGRRDGASGRPSGFGSRPPATICMPRSTASP